MKCFNRKTMLSLLCLTLSSCLVGCGGGGTPTHSVSGKVSVKGKGPLTQGTVQFQSDQFTGSGGIDAEGNYTLSSSSEGDGIPEGEYTVVLLGTSTGGGYNPDPNASSVEVRHIDPKYEARSTSDLKVKVPGGTYDFELEPAP